jgi:tetratricopeptide (TPR) repeat protein
MVFAQRNRLPEAAESFAAALKLEPNHPAALLNLATVQQRLNNPDEALRLYREYLGLQPRPQDWEAVNAIVRAHEPAPALPTRPLATNPVAAVPRSNPPVVAKVETPVTAPKPAPSTSAVVEAKPPAEHMVKPVEDDSKVVVVRTNNSVATSPATHPAPAPASKGFFSKLNPFKREAKASAGEAKPATATKAENGTNAVTAVAAATSPSKTDNRKAAEAELARGQQEQRDKHLVEALQLYRRAINLDESYFEAHFCLGSAAFELRDFKLAATAWQSSLGLRPDSNDARYNYARALQADGRYREAATELEKLLALHPDEARGHLLLGILYAEQVPDIPRARQHYQKVLQLEPQNPQADAIRYWLVANPR